MSVIVYDREKSPYLVLSVSLHIILLLALMYLHWNNTSKQDRAQQEELQEILPIQQDVAALKPRASQFGAPVIFKEEATFTPKNIDNESEIPISEPENIENTQHKSVQPQQEQEVAVQSVQKKLDTSKFQTKSYTTLLGKEQQTTPKQPAPLKPQQALHTRHQSGTQKEDAAPVTKKLTFADLALGFIQTIKNEGQDLLERKGNENIRPDLEEMKLISYKQKVVWFIQNAFRIRYNEEPSHPESIVKCYTFLMLDGEGNIINVQLVYSTGVTEFDKYYLDVLKSAAPFPPIPQHIKKPFVFPFTMIYYTRNDLITSASHRYHRMGISFR